MISKEDVYKYPIEVLNGKLDKFIEAFNYDSK